MEVVFMKKTVLSFLVAGVLVSASATSVLAAGGGSNYTDADNNGICDYAKQQAAACQGLRDSLNIAPAAAESVSSVLKTNSQYMDADNDGVCDNYTGSGSGYGSGSCNGANGSGYVDSDHDGICDHYTNRVCPQDGTGNQHGHRHGQNR